MDTLHPHDPNDNPPKKTCTGPCGRTLDATPEYFHRDKHKKDKLTLRCKECRKDYWSQPEVQKQNSDRNKAYYARPEIREHKLAIGKDYYNLPGVKERQSARMKDYNQRPEVQERRRQSYQSQPEIRERARKQSREYFRRVQNDPERRERKNTRSRAHYYRHHEAMKEVSRLSYQHRKDRVKAYRRLPEAKERLKTWEKDYYARPKTKERKRAQGHAIRSRRRSVKGTYTPAQIQEQLKRQGHRCYYAACGHAKFQKVKGRCVYHVEHTYPLSRVAGTDVPANSIDYIVLSCPTCNLAKGSKFPWEFPEGGRLL